MLHTINIVRENDFIQLIRLVDVFLLGPMMIYIGNRAITIPLGMRLFLLGAGASTILYNGMRYLQIRKLNR